MLAPEPHPLDAAVEVGVSTALWGRRENKDFRRRGCCWKKGNVFLGHFRKGQRKRRLLLT